KRTIVALARKLLIALWRLATQGWCRRASPCAKPAQHTEQRKLIDNRRQIDSRKTKSFGTLGAVGDPRWRLPAEAPWLTAAEKNGPTIAELVPRCASRASTHV